MREPVTYAAKVKETGRLYEPRAQASGSYHTAIEGTALHAGDKKVACELFTGGQAASGTRRINWQWRTSRQCHLALVVRSSYWRQPESKSVGFLWTPAFAGVAGTSSRSQMRDATS